MSEKNLESLTSKECEELSHIMRIKYASYLRDRIFTIKVEVNRHDCLVNITLANQQETFFYPVEGRINFYEQELSPKDAAMLLIDYIDAYFEEFFKEDENVYLPIDWSPYSFEGFTLYLKAQVRNLKAERQADQILGYN